MLRVERVAPPIVRVTVSGPDFADFTSTGPADHVRVYFPDAATGELVAPTPVGPGEDGIVRPDRASISRDFTPLPRAVDGGVEVDLDFFVHPDPGPASAWAESARPGDELVIVGPRGSRRAPQDIDALVLICDETSLPSASRWVRDVPAGISVDVIADDPRLRRLGRRLPRRGARRRHPCARRGAGSVRHAGVLAALGRSSGPIGDGDLRLGGGRGVRSRAGAPSPARALGLPAAQAQVSGYWRRGVEAFDHHAPIDPFDPDA